MKKISYFLMFSIYCICISSCTYDKIVPDPNGLQCDEEFSYDDQIETIINRNCAYSGCHNGTGGVPGNFSFYDGLSSRITTNQFETRVLLQQDMPPADASGPTSLTDTEMADLACWINQGFPKN